MLTVEKIDEALKLLSLEYRTEMNHVKKQARFAVPALVISVLILFAQLIFAGNY